MNYEDFSNHPKSISELKAQKTENGREWGPRDVLIDVLRDIDSGKIAPTAMIVCYMGLSKNDPEIEVPSYVRCASKHTKSAINECLGLLTRTIGMITRTGDS